MCKDALEDVLIRSLTHLVCIDVPRDAVVTKHVITSRQIRGVADAQADRAFLVTHGVGTTPTWQDTYNGGGQREMVRNTKDIIVTLHTTDDISDSFTTTNINLGWHTSTSTRTIQVQLLTYRC